MHLLDILRLHSPVISASGTSAEAGVRSGYPLCDGSIITRIPSEIRSNTFCFDSSDTFGLIDLEINQCLGYADLVRLQSKHTRRPEHREYSLMTSDHLDEGDDVYVYGYKGSSGNRSPIHFSCKEDGIKDGFSLYRAEPKDRAPIKGTMGAPVLNRRTNKICGLVYSLESFEAPEMWIIPMSKVKEAYPPLTDEAAARDFESWKRITRAIIDPNEWLLNMPEKMRLLETIALARLGGHGDNAELLKQQYFFAYYLKNHDVHTDGETIRVSRHQLKITNPSEVRGENHLWKAELHAEIPNQPNAPIVLKWGTCFVNCINETTELLLDNRPSAWTGETCFNGRSIHRITHKKEENFSLTEAALVLMILGFNNYYSGKKKLSNFGGVLKDKNRDFFLEEFRLLRDNNPGLSVDEVADMALRKIPFGANREKLGINDFEVAFYPSGEHEQPDAIYVKKAVARYGDWSELLTKCNQWISMYAEELPGMLPTS